MIAKALSSVNQMTTAVAERRATQADLATSTAPNVYARSRGGSRPGFARPETDAGEAFASPALRTLRCVPVKRIRAVAGAEIAASASQLAQRSQALEFRRLVHTALPQEVFPGVSRQRTTAMAGGSSLRRRRTWQTVQRPCSTHESCRRHFDASINLMSAFRHTLATR